MAILPVGARSLYGGQRRIIEFHNLYLRDMERKLTELPPRSLVFVFGDPLDNRDGHFMEIQEYYRHVTGASTAPVYTFWDFGLGTGMLGRNIITGPDQGRMAAELTLSVLSGVPAGDIPVVMKSPTNKFFDFTALERFGIPLESLPPDAVVIDRPDTLFQQYQRYIWLIGAIFATLAGLVLVLSFLLRKSRVLETSLQAESEKYRSAMEELLQHRDHLEELVAESTEELRRSNETLRDREALFRGMFDQHGAVMFLLDPDTGRFIEANQAALAYYGYTVAQLRSMTIRDINQLETAELRGRVPDIVEKRIRHFEFRHRLSTGEIRDVESYPSPVPFQGKSVIFSIVHDITRRKRAEEDRTRLEVRNHQLQKAENLGRMAGAIAHLFNNHLSVVMGSLEMVLERFSGNADMRKRLIEAMNGAHQASEISGFMLTYLGQGTGGRESLDLSEVCRDHLPVLRNAAPQGIVIATNFAAPGPVVRANGKRVSEVLLHLLTNAWEAIGDNPGTITMSTRALPGSDLSSALTVPTGWRPPTDILACLEITDTGHGIPREGMENIFDPFFTTKFTGRGLWGWRWSWGSSGPGVVRSAWKAPNTGEARSGCSCP